jgi:transposase
VPLHRKKHKPGKREPKLVTEARLGAAEVGITRVGEAVSAELEKQVKVVDNDIDGHLKKTDEWKSELELLSTVPGVGRVTVVALLSQLPELGFLDCKRIAALVGLAPLNNDSGKSRGQRSIRGGRADVRTALYMATLAGITHNPALKAHFNALKARGKSGKVSMVACMRRLLTWLNAMLATSTPWTQELTAA